MPCHGPDWVWTTPTEEQLKEKAEKDRIESIKYMNNTATLLEEVLFIMEIKPEYKILETQALDDYNKEMSDFVTEKLCSILGSADDELKKKISASKIAPYISAWWAEHQKLDKKRENE